MHNETSVLSDELLQRFAERSAGYDRENRFFHEDFEDLRRSGYLTMAVPKHPGGGGFNLAAVAMKRGASPTMRRQRHSVPTCTFTGRASPPICGEPATVP